MLLLILLAVLIPGVFAGDFEVPDVIVLTNGDRLTGEIQKLEKEKLFLKTSYAGTIGIDWKIVEKLHSERTFEIQAESGLRLRGGLNEAPQGLQVVTEDSRIGVSRMNIVSIQPTQEELSSEGFWGPLEGGVDIGYSFARGNTSLNQSTLAMRARYRRDGYQVQANLGSLFSRQTGSPTASRHHGSVRVDRYVTSERFVYGIGGAERDERLKLNLRTNLGGGLGWKFVKSAENEVSLLGGLNFINEQFRQDDPTQPRVMSSSGEGVLGLDLKNTLMAGVQLVTKLSISPNLLQGGRYRMSFESGARMPLIGRYVWTFNIFDRYDSQPPVQAQRNDYGAVSSVGFTF
jgi:hypothetical protein